MLKRKIGLLASIATLSLSATVVTACSVPLDRIATRPINNINVYRTYFNFPVTSWSTGITNKAEDNKILADLFGTLVATDKYDRSYGDLAVQNDKKSRLVGEPNADFTQWTYHISPDAKWFDVNGNLKRNIKASDMINTAKYVLFPKNLSQTFSFWLSFVAGAEDIWEHYQKETSRPPGAGNYWDDEVWKQLGMSADDSANTITFNLVKSSPYFDTLMTYLAFAPMPKEALSAGYNYGRDYQKIFYSGAYLIEQYNSSSRILLRKNPQYRFAKLTYINNIDYTYLGNADVSRPRLLFESGDLTEFVVSPSDSSGWRKYIGPNSDNPYFGGAVKSPNPNIGTFALMYNFTNINMINGQNQQVKEQALNASKALQYDKVRKLLAINLDRNQFVRYFSEALDSGNTSSFLRNVYTARNFVLDETADETDYATYVEQQYADKYYDGDLAQAQAKLKDGSDAFYQNPDLSQSDPNLVSDVRSWLQQNLGQSKINMNFLMNGANNLTSNKKLLDMIDSFNSHNDVINIIPDITVDATDYVSRLRASDYDMMVSGWSPDFADPFSYLNTYSIKGDLETYNGTARVFGDIKFDKDGFAPDFEKLNLQNEYWDLLKNNPAMRDFYDVFKNFTNDVKKSDAITAPDQVTTRYQSFAKTEFNALYEDFMFLPLYQPDGTFRMYVSYVTPRTRPTVGYGSSQYKHWAMQLNRYLLTKKQAEIVEAKYQQDLVDIKKDHSAHRDDY